MQEKTVELLEKVATILKVVVGVRVFANRKGSVPGIYTHSCYFNTIANISNACVKYTQFKNQCFELIYYDYRARSHLTTAMSFFVILSCRQV